MKLFEVLPDQFFHILVGPNKHLYAEALSIIYACFQEERFGIRYEILRDLLQEMIETYMEGGFEFIPEEDQAFLKESGDMAEEQEPLNLEEASRSQANALLRRLEKLGWIDIEIRSNYERYIVLPHYSSRVLALFKELCQQSSVEYQRYAFVTYQLLTGEEAKRRPAFAVREALRMTREFENELSILYNNMKHHMEQVIQKTSIQDVLDHHFETYKKQIVDASYHRLKTSDHVSRYRFYILQTVQNWLLDDNWLAEAVEDSLKSQFYTSREEGEKEIRQALHKIEEIYSGLDEILNQIDLRHNQYLRSSYDRARYLSQHYQGFDQMLAETLELVSRHWLQLSDQMDVLGPHVHLAHISLLSEESLLTPRKRRLPHRPEKHLVLPVSEELIKELRQRTREKVEKAITRQKVEQYVLNRMGERTEMELAELAPQNLEQFMMLPFIYLYGQDGISAFRIRRSAQRTILIIGPYRFTNHLIVRQTPRGMK